jgi:hypothetical protein
VQGVKVQKKVTNSGGHDMFHKGEDDDGGMVGTICSCVNLTYRQGPGVSETWILEQKERKKSGRRGKATW